MRPAVTWRSLWRRRARRCSSRSSIGWPTDDVETPQDPALATYAPKMTKEEGVIDWNAHATTIHDMVRGLQPWPLASAVSRWPRATSSVADRRSTRIASTRYPARSFARMETI